MQSEVRQLTAEEILSEYHRQLLSPSAVRLYVAVWFRMGSRNATEVWLSDEDASCRARILLKDIPAAQSELAKAKLMDWFRAMGKCDTRLSMILTLLST